MLSELSKKSKETKLEYCESRENVGLKISIYLGCF